MTPDYEPMPDYKLLSRGYSRDMSPAAIGRRLDKVADLYELWKSLRTGKRIIREKGNGESSSDERTPLDTSVAETGPGFH